MATINENAATIMLSPDAVKRRARLRLRVAAFLAACLAAALALPALLQAVPAARRLLLSKACLQAALVGWLTLEALFPLWWATARALLALLDLLACSAIASHAQPRLQRQ